MRSPKDLGLKEPGVSTISHQVAVFWDKAAEFGTYLRSVRERKGWTTREAAAQFGVSQAYISKLENQPRKQAPGEDLIHRVAEVYGLDVREVMHEAGYRFDIPRSLELQVSVDEAFRRLLNDPRFRPSGFQPDDERFFAPIVKQQIVDLVLNVARAAREDGVDVEAWLRDGGAP
ncbi:MAG: transcriptional regulator [Deltaproteobacteria bacterium]|nr:transcriptional regulator [Deltaproteobacteria bacterium]